MNFWTLFAALKSSFKYIASSYNTQHIERVGYENIKSLNWVSFWECTFCCFSSLRSLAQFSSSMVSVLCHHLILILECSIHCSTVHLIWYLNGGRAKQEKDEEEKNESRKPFRWIIKHIPIIHYTWPSWRILISFRFASARVVDAICNELYYDYEHGYE